MKIAVIKESFAGEHRVAILPANVGALSKLGHSVLVEPSAGVEAGASDDQYRAAGAEIAADRAAAVAAAEVVVQVRGPGANPEAGAADAALYRDGQMVIAMHDPLWRPESIRELAARGVRVLALETIPRISRAQSMDVLSSMATVTGYGAVLVAATRLPKMFPMMMTAAGTVRAAKVFVLGAGVAGLQAIATARRLGALVQGYDIRPAAVEQIRSLGAKAVVLEMETADAEGAGGYARAQAEDDQRRQRELLAGVVADSDVVIATAAIPGARSPLLLTREMVEGMRAGSMVVDLAAERGGNCELTAADQEVWHRGVLILGPTDLASRYAQDASHMFGNNVTTLIKHLTKKGEIVLDTADEITRDTLIADGGEITHPGVREKLGMAPLPAGAEAAPATAAAGAGR